MKLLNILKEMKNMVDDMINRTDAIMHFVKVSNKYECGVFELDDVVNELRQIPSSHSGIWEKTYKDIGEVYAISVYTCSCCGDYAYSPTKYCPNCGAKMKER